MAFNEEKCDLGITRECLREQKYGTLASGNENMVKRSSYKDDIVAFFLSYFYALFTYNTKETSAKLTQTLAFLLYRIKSIH